MAPSDCFGYRLPTDAEFEVAARCGDDTLFAGSDTQSEVVLGAFGPVAQKRPNRCGLYDMSGNVFEWMGDQYRYMSEGRQASAIDPFFPSPGAAGYSLRGGGCVLSDSYCGLSARLNLQADDVYGSLVGFRLVRTVME